MELAREVVDQYFTTLNAAEQHLPEARHPDPAAVQAAWDRWHTEGRLDAVTAKLLRLWSVNRALNALGDQSCPAEHRARILAEHATLTAVLDRQEGF